MMNKEERNKKVYDFIKGNILNAVIILTSLAYIFYGLVNIKTTGLTVWEVLARAGIGIAVAFIIKECMGENGFNYGYRSQIWIDNRDVYSNVANSANDYIERVDNFYACEEIEKKKRYRRQNLVSAQMRYEWFFDRNGNYTNPKICSVKHPVEGAIALTRYQKRVLRKCLNVRIYNLNLFSEYGVEVENDTKKENTDKAQRKKMLGKNALFGIVGAVVGAYFVPLLKEWNWGYFIQSCVQVSIWIACGAIQLYTNFNYICVEKVAKLKRKCELIIKFKKGCEAGMYERNPYDVMEEEAYGRRNEPISENEQTSTSSVSDDSVGASSLSDNQVQSIPKQNQLAV